MATAAFCKKNALIPPGSKKNPQNKTNVVANHQMTGAGDKRETEKKSNGGKEKRAKMREDDERQTGSGQAKRHVALVTVTKER